MTRIARVHVRRVELDNTTLTTSYGARVSRREHLFVAVHADDGTVGIGEGSPLPHFSGERPAEMEAVVRDVLAPAIVGADAFETEACQQALERSLPHHGASKAALVSALFDLQGKLAGLPVHNLLGGKVRTSIPLAGAIGIERVDQVVERAEALVAGGLRTIKVKVGTDLRRDEGVLRALRERFGDEVELRADANAGYSRPDARRFLLATADLDLQYVEQPLPAEDLHGMAELRRLGTVPIAVDESLFGVSDAISIVRHAAADVFVVKLIKLGGLHNARKVVAIAEAAGIRCVAVSPYETAIGVSANVHLASTSTAFAYGAELGVGVSEVQLPGAEGLEFDVGEVRVPSAPGLGVGLPDARFVQEASPGR